MDKKPEYLYLDLMKKALSFMLWQEPPIPIETHNSSRPALKRLLVSCVSRILRSWKLQLVRYQDFKRDDRYEGKV